MNDADPESLLRSLHAVGEDDRRCVRVEFDGTGDVVAVEVSSVALEGNRAKLEEAIRQALVAATAALREERGRHADAIAAVATRQLGELGEAARALQADAAAQLDAALTRIAAAAERVDR